jgi:hypothetical protein
MLGYSLLFGVAFWTLLFAVFVALQGASEFSKLFLAESIAPLAACFTGWVFVRRHERLLAIHEFRRIVALSIIWRLAPEAAVLAAFSDQLTSTSGAVLALALATLLLLGAGVVYLSYRFPVRKLMRRWLDTHRPAAA